MSATFKDKAAHRHDDRWPRVIDGRAVEQLKTSAQIQYLVIPVQNISGDKVRSRLPDEENIEFKINAFLHSLGLENAIFRMSVATDPPADEESGGGFDLFEGFDEYRAQNSRRKLSLREAVLSEAEWLDAYQLSALAGFENKNRSAGPNTWKSRNKIFAIPCNGKNLYPRYCLDEAYQPLAVVKEILDIFAGVKSGWSLASWFGTGNSWLGGAKPKDVLTDDKNRLLTAAQAAKDGIQHG